MVFVIFLDMTKIMFYRRYKITVGFKLRQKTLGFPRGRAALAYQEDQH